MRLAKYLGTASALVALLVGGSSFAADLPASFPADVPIADYMLVAGSSEVGAALMVDLHAPDKSVDDVVKWFKSKLLAAGWKSEGEQVSARDAILAFKKNRRRCGVVVTDFILDASMQMDTTIKGITVQISGSKAPVDGAVERASEAAGDATN